MIQKDIKIRNKKAKFNYELLEFFDAGIKLQGTEIKSIRMGKASIAESFCEVKNSEVFIVNMHIDEYGWGTHNNHKIKRDRKLLLNKTEINKLEKSQEIKGNAIVPTVLYINDKGLAKVRIAIGKGKKLFDKRNTLKEKDLKRDLQRIQKNF